MKRNKSLLFISLIIPSMILFSACEPKLNLETISFEDTVEIKETKVLQGSKINICVGSMITPEEGYVYYKQLLDYIGKKLNVTINFVEKRTYAEVNALLKNGNVDVAFVCGGPYVKGHDEFGLELLAAPLINGETVYYSYIIVAKDSEISRFEELKGKTFAFADPMSNTGKLIPTLMLQKFGETPRSFFKEYLFTYGHDNSIKAVAEHIVDGAAVDSLIWDYMNKTNNKYVKKTKIIKISEPYGIPPIVVKQGLKEELKTKIKNILLTMHNEEEGKHILEAMFIDRFVEVDDALYNTIRNIKTLGVGEVDH